MFPTPTLQRRHRRRMKTNKRGQNSVSSAHPLERAVGRKRPKIHITKWRGVGDVGGSTRASQAAWHPLELGSYRAAYKEALWEISRQFLPALFTVKGEGQVFHHLPLWGVKTPEKETIQAFSLMPGFSEVSPQNSLLCPLREEDTSLRHQPWRWNFSDQRGKMPGEATKVTRLLPQTVLLGEDLWSTWGSGLWVEGRGQVIIWKSKNRKMSQPTIPDFAKLSIYQMYAVCCCGLNCSVTSDSLGTHGL